MIDANPQKDVQEMRRVFLVMKEGTVVDVNAFPMHPILTSLEAMKPGAVRMK